MADGGRRRLGVVGGVLAAAVLATGVGLYATDSAPFGDSYCWGAWQENSGPDFLGEEALAKTGSARDGTESEPPSAARPRGTCSVAVAAQLDDSDSDEPLTFDERVVVDYGPVPAAPAERHAWLARNFHGSASPLPDGLPGLVGPDRAMLVLPKECDVDGRPSTVTLRGESWGDGHLGRVAMPFAIGARPDVARMLLAAADTGMRAAGCAPDEPTRLTSPMVTVAEDAESAGDRLCRIPGVRLAMDRDDHYREQVGAVTAGLQTCSVVESSLREPDEPAAQYVMAGDPRLAALFDGLPDGTAKGLVRADCDGRRTVFYGHVQGALAAEHTYVKRSFQNFVASVGDRLGCETGDEAADEAGDATGDES